MTRSPWERVLGAQIDQLDPALRAYFGAIPRGSVGRGSGVFDAVGTPRRWLWPVLAVLALDGVLFPVWEKDARLTIVNRPGPHGTIRSTRTFHLASGDRAMVDEIGIATNGLTDRLGRHGFIASALEARVVDAGVELRSTSAELRVGRLRVPLGVLSPRVILSERTFGARQRVSLRLELPIVGLLYEYSGLFDYAVEKES